MNDEAVMKHSACTIHLKETQQPGLHSCLLYGPDFICLSHSLHVHDLFGLDLRCLSQFYTDICCFSVEMVFKCLLDGEKNEFYESVPSDYIISVSLFVQFITIFL